MSPPPTAKLRATLARPPVLSWVGGGEGRVRPSGQGSSGVTIHRLASSPAPRCADRAWRWLVGAGARGVGPAAQALGRLHAEVRAAGDGAWDRKHSDQVHDWTATPDSHVSHPLDATLWGPVMLHKKPGRRLPWSSESVTGSPPCRAQQAQGHARWAVRAGQTGPQRTLQGWVPRGRG